MVRVLALGQSLFEVQGRRITPESDVLFALLLILTTRAGQRVSRAEILDLLWPNSDLSSARHRLRQAVYQLRRLGVPIEVADSTLTCELDKLEVDYLGWCHDVEAATDLIAKVQPLEFLPHYRPAFSERFDDWVESQRQKVHGLVRRYLLTALDRATVRHNHRETIALAQAYLALDPFHVDVMLKLAESIALTGNHAEALTLLDQFRQDCHGTKEAERIDRLRQRVMIASRKRQGVAELESPILGRGEILARLEAWIARGQSVPRILALIGDAGIGKTRLLQEAVRNAGLRGMRVVEYRPSVNGDERPLVALLDVLPILLALPGAVGCSPEAYRRLTTLARGQQGDISLPSDTNDAAFRFAAIRRAVMDLVDAVRGEGEVFIAIDDAQRLDPQSLQILLDAAIGSGGKLALMLAMRPSKTVSSMLAERSTASVITVPRLSPADARELLTRGLPKDTFQRGEQTIEWAVDLADGNPFFLVQLASHCLRDDATGSLPKSLQLSLDERIAALSPNAQLLLQACAILAHNATFARLEVMLGLPAHAMAAALADLHPTGLFAVRGSWVGCRHELIAEAVIRSLGGSLETYLHRRCALLLDGELNASAADSLAWDCARHWDIAQDHDRALTVTFMIVDRLLSLGLPRAAADLSERSRRLCRTADQDAERLLRLSRALRLLHDWDGVAAALTQRHALLGRSARVRTYSEEDILLFEARWWRRFDGRVLRQSHRRVADSRAPTLHRLQMAVIALIAADNRQCRNEAQQVIEIVDSIDPATPREEVELLRARTVYHTSFGSLASAVQSAGRLVATERVVTTAGSLMQSLRWQSKPLALTNNVPAAVSALEESFQLAARLDLRYEMLIAAQYGVNIAVNIEDLSLAGFWAERIADVTHGLKVSPAQCSTSIYLNARMAAMKGELDTARSLLNAARVADPLILRTRGEEPLLAFDIFLRATALREVPRSLVARLRKLHHYSAGCGVHDFETGVLVSSLLRCGETEDARRVYSRYIATRRSQLEQHSVLKTACTAIGLRSGAYDALTTFEASSFAAV